MFLGLLHVVIRVEWLSLVIIVIEGHTAHSSKQNLHISNLLQLSQATYHLNLLLSSSLIHPSIHPFIHSSFHPSMSMNACLFSLPGKGLFRSLSHCLSVCLSVCGFSVVCLFKPPHFKTPLPLPLPPLPNLY